MYRKLIFLFFFLWISPVVSFSDGLSDVLSVCRIELRDGRTIEGVVWVAQGGYNRYYDTNGFYIKLDPATEKVVLFITDFYAIAPYKGIVWRTPEEMTGWGLAAKNKARLENAQVCYLHDVTSKKYQTGNATEVIETVDTLDSSTVLKRDIVYHNIYELLDYIPVFTEVPGELYVGQSITVEPIRVPTKDVLRFILVLEPSQKWLEQIDSAVAEWTKKHQSEENFEVPLPVWFHQIIREREKYVEMKNLFKSWNF